MLSCLPMFGFTSSFAQDSSAHLGFFNITSLGGEVNTNGFYREQQTTTNYIHDNQQYSLLAAGLQLRSSCYLIQPKFLNLDINYEFNPQKLRQQYLVIPEHSESTTLNKFDLRATLFNHKKITLTGFLNLDKGYSSRENLSNIKTDSRNLGGFFIYSNKILPLTISYHEGKWYQEEIQTKRSYNYDQSNFMASITKSFFSGDRNELTYSHDNYLRKELNISSINNISDRLEMNNSIFFDKKKKIQFNSVMSGFNQYGYESFKRYQANENLTFRLPYNFKFLSNYNYYNIQKDLQTYKQQSLNTLLGHRLGECLTTDVFYEINRTNQTVYTESNKKAGFDATYEKKLPTGGRISLSYRYYRQHQDRVSVATVLQVINEACTLTDGKIIMLSKPYINLNTVIVRDNTGTIIYQLNLDYILINRTNYTEIQRVPGGQIANNKGIMVDYSVIQPGSYYYDLTNNFFSASITLFKNLVEVYYRNEKQDYSNFLQVDYLALNYITQQIYGTKLDVGFGSGGIEYNNYQSNIVPYKLVRYYVLFQGKLQEKVLYTINGNLRDYRMLSDQIDQKYSDISASLTIAFNPETKLNIDAGYRNQKGNQINLNLLTSKVEFVTVYKKIFFTLGFEFYKRNYLSENVQFKGTYFKIVRKF